MSKKRDIKFSINQIIIDGKVPTVADFDNIKSEELEKQTISASSGEEEILSIKKVSKTIIDTRYVCIYLNEGNRYPYPEKVIDEELKEVDNPRSVDEIELKDQFFALIDTKSSRIFLSDQRKKALFLSWIGEKIQKNISIKPLIDRDDFINQIKTVSHIYLAVEPNLLNSYNGNTLSSNLAKDIYWFEADEACIDLTYRNKRITEKLRTVIGDKLLWPRSEDLKRLTIVWHTADNFESVFNSEEVISKITISVPTDEDTHLVDGESVFTYLMLQIQQDDK